MPDPARVGRFFLVRLRPGAAGARAVPPLWFRRCRIPRAGYRLLVTPVRILIDGYSLLHQWPEVAAGRPRHSAQAREELIRILTRYQDATGTPVTVFFDARYRRGPAPPRDGAGIEVIYSAPGQTADALIERTAARLVAWGEVLVVTEDIAERQTVEAFGAWTWSCEQFICHVRTALADERAELEQLNRREQSRFQNRR